MGQPERDIDALNEQLMASAEQGNAEVCASVLAQGADPDCVGPGRSRPLHTAAALGHLPVVIELLKAGADLFGRDQFDDTPLLASLGKTDQHAAVTEYLISRNTISHEDSNGLARVFHWAVRGGRSKEVALLLTAGADVNFVYKGDYGHTPLHLAAYRGHTEVAETLLRKGADPLALKQGDSPDTSFWYALIGGHKELANILADAMKGKTNRNGETGLHLVLKATAHSDADLPSILLLVQRGFDVSARDSQGMTPLHWAAVHADAEAPQIIELLLDNGADVNAQNASGWTPLHVAADNSSKAVIELLVSRGADPFAKAADGNYPGVVGRGSNKWWGLLKRIREDRQKPQ